MVIQTGYEVYVGKLDFRAAHSHYGDRRNWNLLLSLDGELRLEIDGRSLTVGPETLFMIAPGAPRKFVVASFWQTYFLHFNMDRHINVRPEWNESSPGVYTVLPTPADYAQMSRVFAEVYRVCSIRRHGWYLLAYTLIQELILLGNMACHASALGEHIEPAARMLEDLDENISEIARKCSMSRTSFFNMFRSTFGTTPARYRERQMLIQAQALLENTDMSIKEIAQNLNIAHPCYLTARFHRAFGMSPREYRKSRRGEISRTAPTCPK